MDDSLWNSCPECRHRFIGNLCPSCGWDEAKAAEEEEKSIGELFGAIEDMVEEAQDPDQGAVFISVPLDFRHLQDNPAAFAEKLEEVAIVSRNSIKEAWNRWRNNQT